MKRLAIWTHGGLGGGLFGQGFPMIVQIVEQLALHFDVTVYSAAPVPHDFTVKGYRVCSPPANMKLWKCWMFLVRHFLKHHFKNRYDVLYAFWGYPAGVVITLLGKIVNKPSVVTMLGAETIYIPEIDYGHMKGLRKKILLWSFKHCNTLLAVSQSQIDNLRKVNFIRDIPVIHWGVDPQKFYCIPKPTAFPLKIVHVANLTGVKDQETLIRAFHIIREKLPAQLRIIGPDYLNGSLQKLVAELGLRDVEFTGAIAHKNIAEHYQWADAFMLTSLSEGQNISLMEAMMCGLVPVSTAVMHELQGRGIIAPLRDYESLGNQVVRAYQHPDEWQKIQKDAMQWASQYDLHWTINQLTTVLHGAK